jgi:predicted DNA-binding transcriptional regulator
MALLAQKELSTSEIALSLGLLAPTGALKRTLRELVKDGHIGYLLTDKPQSRLQKYRIIS